jgi:hypothetical protein
MKILCKAIYLALNLQLILNPNQMISCIIFVLSIFLISMISSDIKDRWSEHWPVTPDQATRNSCASGHCKHSAAMCSTQAKSKDKPGNTEGGSITEPLTSCLTGLESAA